MQNNVIIGSQGCRLDATLIQIRVERPTVDGATPPLCSLRAAPETQSELNSPPSDTAVLYADLCNCTTRKIHARVAAQKPRSQNPIFFFVTEYKNTVSKVRSAHVQIGQFFRILLLIQLFDIFLNFVIKKIEIWSLSLDVREERNKRRERRGKGGQQLVFGFQGARGLLLPPAHFRPGASEQPRHSQGGNNLTMRDLTFNCWPAQHFMDRFTHLESR